MRKQWVHVSEEENIPSFSNDTMHCVHKEIINNFIKGLDIIFSHQICAEIKWFHHWLVLRFRLVSINYVKYDKNNSVPYLIKTEELIIKIVNVQISIDPTNLIYQFNQCNISTFERFYFNSTIKLK